MEKATTYNFPFDDKQPLSLVCIGQAKTSPNHQYGPATRGYYLIHYITEGKGTFIVDGVSYHLQKGQGFLITPYAQTFYIADQEKPWSYVWIGFGGNLAKFLVQKTGLSSNEPIFSTKEGKILEQYIQIGLKKASYTTANQLYLLGMLYQFMSVLANSNIEKIPTTLTDDYVSQAISYIQEHIHQPLTIQEIATHVGIDRSYLTTKFKKITGLAPIKYVQNYRLTLAKHYLEVSDLTIEEIANKCGYQRTESLNKVFKEKYQLNLSAYRKKYGV